MVNYIIPVKLASLECWERNINGQTMPQDLIASFFSTINIQNYSDYTKVKNFDN